MAAPEGYYVVTDENHIVQGDDLYRKGRWMDNPGNYYRIKDYLPLKYCNEMLGQPLKFVRQYIHMNTFGYGGFFVATKGIIKPRFETIKPYPYGY